MYDETSSTMNFVFQHVFYCHVYHRSLRYISYKAEMAKQKEYLTL